MSERKSNNLLVRVFLSYAPSFKGYRFWMFFMFVAYGFATLISNAILPLVYRSIIDTVSTADVRGDVVELLFQNFHWLVVCIVAYQLFYRAGDYSIVYAQSRIMKHVSDRTFSALEQHSYHFFSGNFVGSLVAKAKRYVKSFEDLFDQFVFSIWMTLVNLMGILVTLFILSPFLGGAFLVWVIFYLLAAWWVSKKKAPYDLAVAEQDSTVVGRLSDVVSNMLAVKMFSAGLRERSQFEEATDVEERLRRRAWNFQNFTFIVQVGLLSILEIGGMYGAIRFWIAGSISTGTVVLVQIYISSIAHTLFAVGRVFSKMTGSLAYADEMIEVFDSAPDIFDPEHPEVDRMKSGRIEFCNVSFDYADGENVFTDFSFAIQDGEKVGIVGPSGAGKSTVTKLLLRFVDPQVGKITIDGQDIRAVRQDDLRRHIAYVPQEPMLFHRSIRENIAYSKPEATIEEVIAAAKKAEAHDFISRLPHGYDTLVGERGVKLSGGERQRVAIARAILKDAEILVLDEATSSLDSESEHAIQEALDELMVGKTAVVIAHRLSTIRKLDRILVLNRDGQIEEEGKHDELLTRNGLYANLWNRQTGNFLSEGE
ncbi:MAG: ABC transporter ATP-binding protein [Candidatus Moraniibacteriota bacterium]|nr:MAG: ABC transporter ATP-binding protein [Candidatus Moranbacteria bacterium]